jgi:hypothetical protein
MTERFMNILCPFRKREIPLDEVLIRRLREKLPEEFNTHPPRGYVNHVDGSGFFVEDKKPSSAG